MAWARLCCGRRTQGRPGVAREAWTALDQESKQRRRGSAWLLWRVRLKPLLGSARGRDDQHRRRHTRPAHRAWDHRALVHIPGVRLLRHPRRRAAAPQTKRMTPGHRACRGSAKGRQSLWVRKFDLAANRGNSLPGRRAASRRCAIFLIGSFEVPKLRFHPQNPQFSVCDPSFWHPAGPDAAPPASEAAREPQGSIGADRACGWLLVRSPPDRCCG
jgi:hypothetical protein